jgi:transposase
LCGILPALDVAELEGLDKGTVYRIDRKWLKARESLRQDKPVRYLGIDEIAIRKGQRYATVFYDLERREVIGLVRDRTQRRTSGFFRRWGKAQCKQVVAVCMDLWAAYQNSVRRHCKQAAVVFDKFHVYGYLTHAIDEVRREEQRTADQAGRQLLKGSRWLWLRRPDRLRRKEKQTLQQIVELNAQLEKAYLLREDFEGFYVCEDKPAAEAFLKEWIARCQESRLRPFVKLAKRLKRWAHGILAYFDYPITNAVSEGINNKIKVLKRRSYGFHDIDYFFLKILDATGALPLLEALSHTF